MHIYIWCIYDIYTWIYTRFVQWNLHLWVLTTLLSKPLPGVASHFGRSSCVAAVCTSTVWWRTSVRMTWTKPAWVSATPSADIACNWIPIDRSRPRGEGSGIWGNFRWVMWVPESCYLVSCLGPSYGFALCNELLKDRDWSSMLWVYDYPSKDWAWLPRD